MVEGSGSRSPWFLVAIVTLLLLALGGAAAPGRALATDPETLPCLSSCNEGQPPAGPDLLVINLGWETGKPATSAPLTESTLDNALQYLRGTVNPWFDAAAPGIFREWPFIRGGSYSIAPPKAVANESCRAFFGFGNDVSFDELVESGDAAARAHGVDLSAYRAVIYVWSHSVCKYEGITNEGRTRIGLPVLATARHELGHYMGLPHANSLACKDASGKPVTLSETCQVENYGDPFDMMGQRALGFTAITDGLYNALYENALGWLPEQVLNLNAEESVRSFTLKPLSEPHQSPRALRLVDGPTTLWLEYRQPTGLDTPSVPGLTFGLFVHREVSRGAGKVPFAQLLDMSPETPFEDPGLRVGQTWTNPLGDAKITLASAGPTAATVTLSSQHVRVPDVGGLSFTRAKEVLAANRLTGSGGGSVKDRTCASIGVVATQTPFAGDRVFEGTSVNLGIGVEDPKHPCR